MKIKLLFTMLICLAFAKATTAQTSQFTARDITGIYTLDSQNIKLPKEGADRTYTGSSLTLSSDGRFEYHNYRQLDGQSMENWYGRGNWTYKGKVVYFTSSSEDLDKKYTIDLNNAKARFFKQSPRSKRSEVPPTYLQFFTSEHVVARTIKLYKTDE